MLYSYYRSDRFNAKEDLPNMEMKRTIEELELENKLLKETITVQHETINRLLDTYVLKRKPEPAPKYPKR